MQDNSDAPQGRQTGYEWTPPQIVPPQHALRRSSAHSTDMPLPWIGGVCAGISSMLGISVRVVRFAFLIALPAYGLSLVVYLWLWLTVPEDLGGDQSGSGRLRSPLASAEEIARRESQQRNLRMLLVGLGSLGLALAIAYLLFAGIAGLRDIASACTQLEESSVHPHHSRWDALGRRGLGLGLLPRAIALGSCTRRNLGRFPDPCLGGGHHSLVGAHLPRQCAQQGT